MHGNRYLGQVLAYPSFNYLKPKVNENLQPHLVFED